MKKISVTTGIGFDAKGNPIGKDEVNQAHQLVRQVALGYFGGVTILSGTGAWIAPDNSIVSEPVLIYTAMFENDNDAGLFAAQVKSIFRQASVGLTIELVNVQFV